MTREDLQDSLVAALNQRKGLVAEMKKSALVFRNELRRIDSDIDRYRAKLSGEDKQMDLDAG